jgi:hypothetical protein
MKKQLSYFELLSSYPILVDNNIHIKSPTLKDIFDIGENNYSIYCFLLKADVFDLKKIFNNLSIDINKGIFENLTLFDELRIWYHYILNFFISEDVIYSNVKKCFIIGKLNQSKSMNVYGEINSNNFGIYRNLILKLNYIDSCEDTEAPIANEKAKAILEHLKQGREKANQNKIPNKNLSLGNIVSHLATYKHCDISSIYNYTIFQLYDQFSQQTNKWITDINSMSLAHWGGEMKKSWCENTYEKN